MKLLPVNNIRGVLLITLAMMEPDPISIHGTHIYWMLIN